MKFAVQVTKRLLSATAISRPPLLSPPFTSPPPPHCNLSPQFTSAAGDEKVSIMLYKCKTIKQLKQVHLRMLINGLKDDDNCSSYLADKFMLLASDLISFNYAYKVFMYLSSNPNLSSYNVLIKCSIGKSDTDSIATSAYNRMRNQDNISPDRFTFGFLFKTFASSRRLKSGKTIHGHVIKLGFISDTFVMNSLLEFYFKFVHRRSRLRSVRKVFDEMPERDIVSWNAMISSLVNRLFMFTALLVFDDVLLLADHRCKPDETTLINIIYACRMMVLIEQGKWLDAYIKENKLALSIPLGNALIDMFVDYNDLGNAKVVFESMSRRCTITWGRMLNGLICNQFDKEALLLFDTMCCFSEEGGLKPDDNIFFTVLAAFYNDKSLLGDGKRLFRAIHKMVHEFGVKPSQIHYITLIRILSQAGWVEEAMMLAESSPREPNAMGWRCEPDPTCWGHVLYACQIHGNENLLDSWIRKIDDVNSKQDRPSFMMLTLSSYINAILDQRGDDMNYAKFMVESLITKLPEQKHVDCLNNCLKAKVKRMESTEAHYRERCYHLSSHVQETHPPLEDDEAYKVVESLHDQIVSIIDHHCQLAI